MFLAQCLKCVMTLGQSANEDLDERTLRARESGMLAHPLQEKKMALIVCMYVCVCRAVCVCVRMCMCNGQSVAFFKSINTSYVFTHSVWCS